MSACQRKLTYRQPQKQKEHLAGFLKTYQMKSAAVWLRKRPKIGGKFFASMSPKIAGQEKEKDKNSNSEEKRKETGNNKNQWLHS